MKHLPSQARQLRGVSSQPAARLTAWIKAAGYSAASERPGRGCRRGRMRLGQRRRATGFTLMQAGKDPRGGRRTARPAGEVAAQADGIGWDYAPAPESREIVTLAPEYGLFVNGEFVP